MSSDIFFSKPKSCVRIVQKPPAPHLLRSFFADSLMIANSATSLPLSGSGLSETIVPERRIHFASGRRLFSCFYPLHRLKVIRPWQSNQDLTKVHFSLLQRLNRGRSIQVRFETRIRMPLANSSMTVRSRDRTLTRTGSVRASNRWVGGYGAFRR